MRGFTLIEVLVVMAVTVILTGLLIMNFNRTTTDLNQGALLVADAVREAQASAVSGALLRGTYRCGYGVHFQGHGLIVFAGPEVEGYDCASDNRTFDAGGGGADDDVVRTVTLANPALEIGDNTPDVFFAPPDPTTYIGGSAGGSGMEIWVRKTDAECPGPDCRIITVSPYGLVQIEQ